MSESKSKLDDVLAEEDKNCPVCMELLLDKIFQCVRGHVICKKCLDELLQTEPAYCPICNMAFDSKNLSRNRFAEQVMGSTLIKCSCDILVKSSELESHKLHKCTNIRLKCKFTIFGCTELSERSLLQQHEEKCGYYVSDKVFPALQLIANFREFYAETLYQITTPQMKPESYEVQFKIPETLHDTIPQLCFT